MSSYAIKTINLKQKSARHAIIGTDLSAPPLIYLPGNLQSISNVESITLPLSRDALVHVIELPGNTGEYHLPSNYDMGYLADCVHEYVSRFVGKKVHIAASSYSTAIALTFAVKYPDLISSLSLSGAAQYVPEQSVARILKILYLARTDRQAFAEAYTDLLTVESDIIKRNRAIRRASQKMALSMEAVQLECFHHNMLRLLNLTPREHYPIEAPTICFTGEKDPFITPADCEQLSDSIPLSKFTTLKNSDHLIHIEAPTQMAGLIANQIHAAEYRMAA
ncbi:MAG: hypothetical protein COA42_04245 [Alteromonadaceae bacterium]|nr:MAG: hypothetical protein COA42_04245 [Alteromonadaceae bacterium]